MSVGDNIRLAITAAGTTASTGYQLDGNISFAAVSVCTSAAYGLTLGNNVSTQLKLSPWNYEIYNGGVSALTVFAPTDVSVLINGATSIIVQPGQRATISFTSATVGYSKAIGQAGASSAVPSMTALAGGAQPTLAANIITPSQYFVNVSTCATAKDSVGLPAVPNLNVPYVIMNSGAAACSVYPGLSTGTSTINSLAANIPVFIGAGASMSFVALTNAAGVINWSAYGYTGPVPVLIGGATRNIGLNEGMNGAIILASQAAARVYTMPAVAGALGYVWQFIISASAANTVTITCPAGTLNGQFRYGAGVPTAVTGVNAAANASVVFANSQVIGSNVKLWSDGAAYYGDGQSTIASGFTVS